MRQLQFNVNITVNISAFLGL